MSDQMNQHRGSSPPRSSRGSVKFKTADELHGRPSSRDVGKKEENPPLSSKSERKRPSTDNPPPDSKSGTRNQSMTPSTQTTTPSVLPRFYPTDRRPTIESPVGPEGQVACVPPLGMDKLNTEYFYYTVALREMLPLMSRAKDKKKLLAWVEKLTSPAYQTLSLREKRNKYLLKLTLTVINDEAFDVFSHFPPNGILPPVEEMVKNPVPARWEMDTFWNELLRDLPLNWDDMGCSVHEECSEDRDETGRHSLAGVLLDQEFKFFLYLSRPFTMLVDNPADQAKLCLWLQTLARIRPTACLAMKGIRNDYMQALLGYIQDLRLTGPFRIFPSLSQPLPPLVEFIKRQNQENPGVPPGGGKPLTDPTNPLVESFLDSQPKPENGAFCYIAITGHVKDLTAIPQAASMDKS